MADDIKPKKGDYITARRVENGDHTDDYRDEGVVIGLPRPGNGGYYDILSPYDQSRPFQGHVDDALVVPDENLSETDQSFKQWVNNGMSGDPQKKQ